MKPVEQKMKDYIASHMLESRKSAAKMSLAIQESPLEYEVPGVSGNVPIYTRTLQIPKFFTQQDKKNFEEICRMFYGIFEKTIEAYRTDPAVRRLFRFQPSLDHLIRLQPRYKAAIPILRVDIFYNEETGDFKVCEFNTDGTSAMFENNTMAEFQKYNNAFTALDPDVEYMELMDTWADALIKDAVEATGKEKPAIAITDFLENAYLPELQAFEKLFQKRGYTARMVDIRDFAYDGKQLTDPKDGQPFDVIYRRAVTRDVMEHLHDIEPFIRAVSDGNVVVIGAFQTQIPHSKTISMALFEEPLRKHLTQEECAFIDAHMPATFNLTRASARKILKDRQKWIIKPKDSYGAKGVWAGVDVSQKLWEKLVTDFADAGYIVQEYIEHYKTPNIDLLNHREFLDYSNMTGLYVYNGEFAGVYSRLSDMGIISTQYNERMVPTFFLKEENK